jgi:hypothetical protein
MQKLRKLSFRYWVWGVLSSCLMSPAVLAQDVLFLPVLGSQPETGFQFGIAGIWEQSAEPDAVALNVFTLASERRQYRANVELQTPGWLARRQDRLEFAVLLRDFPDDFYGYQANFMDTGLSYSEQSLGGSLRWWVPLNPQWQVGLGVRYLTSQVQFDQPNDALLDGVAWRSGGTLWGINGALQRDTRNQPDWPQQGTLVTLELNALATQQTWPVQASLEALHFQALQPRFTLATGVQWQAATANTPFLLMPELSGTQWLRGARGGQFRHQTTVAAQSELRAELSPRWAAVGFTHIGQVGVSPEAWFDSAWKWGGGAGLRFSVSGERRRNLRLDYGLVDGRSGVILNFGEAF